MNGVEHVYYLNGSQILAESWGSVLCVYLYDANGSPIGMQYRTTSYAEGVFDTFWFTKNVHGDIVSVYNDAGTKLLTYHYDAWGNFSTQWHTYYGSDYYASYNPFKYRGYYHDSETGFYYLNSRYYDPATGRFLNADGLISTGQGLLGYNMYAYCNNNPVNRVDFSGRLWVSVALAAVCVIGFVGLLTSCSSQSSEDDSEYEYEYQGQSFSQGYDTMDEAAIAAAMLIEAKYQEQIDIHGYLGKYEYSTIIYQFPGDPKFYVSERYVHTDGNGGSVKPQSEKPDYATIVGRIHSHPWQNDIKFSEQDTINTNSNSNVEYYLAEFDRYSNELLTVYHFKRGERPATRKELIWPINNV